jgi:muramoyltetrapeptide carboxypeptidase
VDSLAGAAANHDAPSAHCTGATIGVVTLATPAETRAAVERGVEWWESKGYRVRLGASTRERGGDFAGPPELRAADLQDMLADPGIAAIQTTRGGYGTVEILPLLDFDAIAENPKALVGFSDITNLHLGLARAGVRPEPHDGRFPPAAAPYRRPLARCTPG